MKFIRDNWLIAAGIVYLIVCILVGITNADTLALKANTIHNLAPNQSIDAFTGLVPPYSALPPNCSIVCESGTATIAYASNQGYAFKSESAGRTFKGLSFTKGGLFLEGAGARDVTVSGNQFWQSVTTGPKRCGLEVAGAPLTNGKITDNLFAGKNGSFGLYSETGATDSNIVGNEFLDVKGAMHWTGTFTRTTIEQNYMRGIVAQAFEIQGGGVGNTIQDNWVEYHRLMASGNNDAYSYSVPLQDAVDTIIRRNVSIQKPSAEEPDKIGVRIVFEIGGKNTLMEDNYSYGGNHVIAGNGANGTGTARNNRLIRFQERPRNDHGNTTTYTNNGPGVTTDIGGKQVYSELGPDVSLSAEMKRRIAAGDKPGRWKRYGVAVPAPTPITGPPTTNLADFNAIKLDRDTLKAQYDVLRKWADQRP